MPRSPSVNVRRRTPVCVCANHDGLEHEATFGVNFLAILRESGPSRVKLVAIGPVVVSFCIQCPAAAAVACKRRLIEIGKQTPAIIVHRQHRTGTIAAPVIGQ